MTTSRLFAQPNTTRHGLITGHFGEGGAGGYWAMAWRDEYEGHGSGLSESEAQREAYAALRDPERRELSEVRES